MQQNWHKDDKNQCSVLMLMILPSIYQFSVLNSVWIPQSNLSREISPKCSFIDCHQSKFEHLIA